MKPDNTPITEGVCDECNQQAAELRNVFEPGEIGFMLGAAVSSFRDVLDNEHASDAVKARVERDAAPVIGKLLLAIGKNHMAIVKPLMDKYKFSMDLICEHELGIENELH